jgi:D-amino-acid dehydrogenase
MLFDRSSAVRMRWRYLPQLAPWLVRFLLAGRQKRVEAIADALQPLVSRAYDAHRELIAQSGADDLVSIREHLESLESLVIRWWQPDSQDAADVDEREPLSI